MPIKLELTFASFDELADFTARQNTAGIKVTHIAKTEPAKKKEQSFNDKLAAKAEKEVAETSEEIEGTVEEEDVEGESDTGDAPTWDEVREAVLKVNKLKGKEAAKKILAKFGAEKVGPQLKEKDYAAVVKECNRVIG